MCVHHDERLPLLRSRHNHLQTHLPRIANLIIDDIQKEMDQLQANISKAPNIPVDVLENVTKNTANWQKTIDSLEKNE